MPRDLDHLELPRVRMPLPRRLHGGGRPPAREKEEHGGHLLLETEEVMEEHKKTARPRGITPTLVFRLKMHRGADIEEDILRRMGLYIISKDADKAVVVFSSDEALGEFKRYLAEYSGQIPGHAYAFLAGIDDVIPLLGGAMNLTYTLAGEEHCHGVTPQSYNHLGTD